MAARRRYQAQQVLPEEYDELFPTEQLQPEQRLMLAILEDAFARFQRALVVVDGHGNGALEEVEDWFMTDDDHRLYSLETICTHLDIDASGLRKRLMMWRTSRQVRGRQTNPAYPVEKLEFLMSSRKRGGL